MSTLYDLVAEGRGYAEPPGEPNLFSLIQMLVNPDPGRAIARPKQSALPTAPVEVPVDYSRASGASEGRPQSWQEPSQPNLPYPQDRTSIPSRPPAYDPNLYEAPIRTASGGYEMRGKPRPQIGTLGELANAAKLMKSAGVPDQTMQDILLQMMGKAGIDREAAQKSAIAQILLRHKLGEPEREEKAGERKEGLKLRREGAAQTKSYQQEMLDLRRKEGESRAINKVKVLGDYIDQMALKKADIVAKFGEQGYAKIRQKLVIMQLMELLGNVDEEDQSQKGITVKRRD